MAQVCLAANIIRSIENVSKWKKIAEKLTNLHEKRAHFDGNFLILVWILSEIESENKKKSYKFIEIKLIYEKDYQIFQKKKNVDNF